MPEQEQASTPARRRDPYFDNARALLITLVVVGHVLEATESRIGNSVYLWIYSFHMPAFVLVSGYLARNFTATRQQCASLVTTLLVPYLLFDVLVSVERAVLRDEPFQLDLLRPGWTLWFLVALVVWRLLTPLLGALRRPLLVAVVVAVVAPVDGGLDQLASIARVLSFLPFYVLGTVLTREAFARLATRRVRAGAVVALAGIALGALLLEPSVRRTVFAMSSSYPDQGDNLLAGALVRLGALGVGLVGTLAVLALTSRRERWYTHVGRNSLTVYLFQAVILYPFALVSPNPQITLLGVVASVLAGVALTALLGSEVVTRRTRWITQPPAAWLIAREAPAGREPEPAPAGTTPPSDR